MDPKTAAREARMIMDKAEAEGRTMTAEETRRVDELIAIVDRGGLDQQRAALDGQRPVKRDRRLLPGYNPATDPARARPAVLTREQRMADLVPHEDRQADLSIGKFIRGVATGRWDAAEEERAMAIGTGSAGGYLVPAPLAAGVIDLARNQTRVMQAGALTVPMSESTLTIAKVTGDPTAGWYAENATTTASDMTLGTVQFVAKTLRALVKFSRELFEDAANLDSIIQNSLARAFALELDRVALYGSGSGAEPTGLRNVAGLGTTSMGTNGAALANYDPFVDGVYAVQNANFEPNAAIYAPRTQQAISKLKDANDNPLTQPSAVAALAKLVTKQVPVNRTQGTANNASDVFVGEWANLLIGMRVELGIEFLRERYSADGQYAANAWMRCDIQVAHKEAFNAIVGIIP